MNPSPSPEIKKRSRYGGGNHRSFLALGTLFIAIVIIRSGQKIQSCTEWTVEQGYSQTANSFMGWHPLCVGSISLDYLVWSLFFILLAIAIAPKLAMKADSLIRKVRSKNKLF